HTSAGGVTIVVPTSDKVYRDTAAADPQETTFAYQWHSNGGNVTNQVKRRTVTPPTVTVAQNGPGTAVTRDEEDDGHGRLIWERDKDGYLHYTAYDPGTGAVMRRIADVDTTQTADFQNLPSDGATPWATPSGGGLHLKTDTAVDTLGRATLVTTPEGNKTY